MFRRCSNYIVKESYKTRNISVWDLVYLILEVWIETAVIVLGCLELQKLCCLQTDGQMEKVNPVYPPPNFVGCEYKNKKIPGRSVTNCFLCYWGGGGGGGGLTSHTDNTSCNDISDFQRIWIFYVAVSTRIVQNLKQSTKATCILMTLQKTAVFSALAVEIIRIHDTWSWCGTGIFCICARPIRDDVSM